MVASRPDGATGLVFAFFKHAQNRGLSAEYKQKKGDIPVEKKTLVEFGIEWAKVAGACV